MSSEEKQDGYVGLNINEGIFVPKEDAYAYAFERCVNGTDEEVREFQEMLVEWFYSGDWLQRSIYEEV